MRVVAFNMRAGGSVEHWREMLRRLGPDLALVQETRDPRPFAAELGVPPGRLHWEAVEHGRWGSAILAPCRPRRRLPVEGFAGWVLGVEVTAWQGRRRPVHAYSVHVPARRISYVREANAMLDAILERSDGADLILGGDFNLTVAHRAPDEARRNSLGEQRFLERTEAAGLVNAWRVLHPDGPLPQTLRWTRDPVTPYHCDEILVPAYWDRTVRQVATHRERVWRRLSDHNPVSVDLGWPGRRPPSTR